MMYSSDDSEFDYDTKEKEIELYTLLYFGSSSHLESDPHAGKNDNCTTAVLQDNCDQMKNRKNELEKKQTNTNATTVEPDHSERKARQSISQTVNKTKVLTKFVKLKRSISSIKTKAGNVLKKRRLNEEEKSAAFNGHAQRVKRRRTSSICSLDSITGREPLDNLYCKDISDDETNLNVIAETDFEDCVSHEPNNMNEYRDEESRCNMNLKTKQKNTRLEHSRTDHSPDQDVFILPPLIPKIPNIEALSSSSDESIKIVTYVKKNRIAESGIADNDLLGKEKRRKFIKNTQHIIPSSDTDDNDLLGKEKRRKFIKNTHHIIPSSDTDYNDLLGKEKRRKFIKNIQHISLSSDTDDNSDTDHVKLSCVPLTFNLRSNVNSSVRNIKSKSRNKKIKPSKSQVIFSKGRPLTMRQPSCPKWTQDMTSLYDSDYSDDFSVEDVHEIQSDCVRQWKICCEDRRQLFNSKRRRYFEERCSRCREFGHTVRNCSRVPHCLYCASTTHIFVNQCPHNCCLVCGGKPHGFCYSTQKFCNVCSSFGHDSNLCPDLWRRYHVTTVGCVPVVPDTNSQSAKSRIPYCYNCAKKGHYGHECRMNNAMKYVPLSTRIVSYSNPYTMEKQSVPGPLREKGSVPAASSSFEEEVTHLLNLSRYKLSLVIGKRESGVRKIMKRTNTKVTYGNRMKNQLKIVGLKKDVEAASSYVLKFLHGKGENCSPGTVVRSLTSVPSQTTEAEIKNQRRKKKPLLCSVKSPRHNRLDDEIALHTREDYSPLGKRVQKDQLQSSRVKFPHKLKKLTSILYKFPLSLPLKRLKALTAISHVLNPIKRRQTVDNEQKLLALKEHVYNYFYSHDVGPIHNENKSEFHSYVNLLVTLTRRKSDVLVTFIRDLRKVEKIVVASKDHNLDPVLYKKASSIYTAIIDPSYELLLKMVASVIDGQTQKASKSLRSKLKKPKKTTSYG